MRAIDVFPIPPGPMRAIEVRLSARPTIFSINSSRQKQAPSDGGGVSPGGTLCEVQNVDPMISGIANLVRV